MIFHPLNKILFNATFQKESVIETDFPLSSCQTSTELPYYLEQIDQTLSLASVWDILLNRHTCIPLKLKLNHTRSLSNLKTVFWQSLTYVRLWKTQTLHFLRTVSSDTLSFFFFFTLWWSCASLASSQWKSTFFTKLAECMELKSWRKPRTHVETATTIRIVKIHKHRSDEVFAGVPQYL